MSKVGDQWTDSDPKPGDFDADLSAIDPRYVEAHVGNPNAELTIVGVEEEDAERSATTRCAPPSLYVASRSQDWSPSLLKHGESKSASWVDKEADK